MSLFHDNKYNVYNIWLVEPSRPLGGHTRTYDNSLQESIDSRRLNEPLSYYWHDVRDALSLSMDTPISLQNGFWPSTRIAHAVEYEFIEEGDVCKEYGEDDHFVGNMCDRLPPSF